MWTTDVFRAREFRLALAFCLVVSAATAAVFALIYLQVSREDVLRVGAVLVDEAAKSEGDSEDVLQQALKLRLTRDIRRLDYVALFDAKGQGIFGNVPTMPPVPVDGKAHFVRQEPPDGTQVSEPTLFVARKRADGGVLLLGRSLREAYELQETVLRALGLALVPTILLSLAIGVYFARRATLRFERLQAAIARIMAGDLGSRLPVDSEANDIDRVARNVNLMLDEIARLLDQLKNVGDNIAHDLRTPLAVVRAKIERALENEIEPQTLFAALSSALAQVDKASSTISAILRIPEVASGNPAKHFHDFDLGALCEQVFEFYEPLAESKSIAITLDVAKTVLIRGDEDLMREAISNLVDNAIKFTPPGGQICIRASATDGRAIASVSDTGCGVPPEERDKIFHRFYRTGNGGEAGYGLGLSITETIAKLHGFDLSVVDNSPGARFELRGAVASSHSTAQQSEPIRTP